MFKPVLAAVAAAGIVFQVVHLVEHVAQLGYWVANPVAAPWITPWAAAGRDALAVASDAQPASGTELLHLVGNLIFLAALVAALALVGRSGSGRSSFLTATYIQTAHVAEHVLLTVSWFLGGEAAGVSTLFGLLTPADTRIIALRVWFHFLINLAATVFALRGTVLASPLFTGQQRAPRPLVDGRN